MKLAVSILKLAFRKQKSILKLAVSILKLAIRNFQSLKESHHKGIQSIGEKSVSHWYVLNLR
jgi:hypothetical protein